MERIAIVDEHDNFLGEEDKEKCHDGEGILHRAFLSMVFTGSGELLLARRSDQKRLWPGFWDGTVASHLGAKESYQQASIRRLEQELGIVRDHVNYLFKFQYKVAYKNVGTEHEICAVTTARGVDASSLLPNEHEISDIRAIGWDTLMNETVTAENEKYAPWFLIALTHFRQIGIDPRE